jgi:hypothetical protein
MKWDWGIYPGDNQSWPPGLTPQQFRKSSQFFMLTRRHARLAVDDTVVNAFFRDRLCWDAENHRCGSHRLCQTMPLQMESARASGLSGSHTMDRLFMLPIQHQGTTHSNSAFWNVVTASTLDRKPTSSVASMTGGVDCCSSRQLECQTDVHCFEPLCHDL